MRCPRDSAMVSNVRANWPISPTSSDNPVRLLKSPPVHRLAAWISKRIWRRMYRSPPNQAAPSASSPTTKPDHGSLLWYISTQAGAMATKTVPTNLARKLENRIIGRFRVLTQQTITSRRASGKGALVWWSLPGSQKTGASRIMAGQNHKLKGAGLRDHRTTRLTLEVGGGREQKEGCRRAVAPSEQTTPA